MLHSCHGIRYFGYSQEGILCLPFILVTILCVNSSGIIHNSAVHTVHNIVTHGSAFCAFCHILGGGFYLSWFPWIFPFLTVPTGRGGGASRLFNSYLCEASYVEDTHTAGYLQTIGFSYR
jgi:hypothetical protein